jgi:hypothetical protein
VQVKTQSGEFIYDSTEVSALPLLLFGAGETLLPPSGCLLRLGAGGKPLLDVAQEEVLRSHAASLQVTPSYSFALPALLCFRLCRVLHASADSAPSELVRARAFCLYLGTRQGPPLYGGAKKPHTESHSRTLPFI